MSVSGRLNRLAVSVVVLITVAVGIGYSESNAIDPAST